MISSLLASAILAAAPDLSAAITEARRTFIEDGDDRVSATATHRVISHADGSLELQGEQPLTLSLQSVGRGGAKPCRAVAQARLVEPAAPRTVRTQRACALEETWTNGPEGLAQTFILKRPPPGTGALTLSVAVRGPWHHHDANGQVFAGPGAATALRYGNAFVVRAGRKLPIAVRHVAGGLELEVPRALIDAPGAFPMIIDPVLSNEVPLDPNVSGVQALPTVEQTPAIALNSSGLPMVVWVDNRRQNGTDIFGARLDSTGSLLDSQAIPVALEPGHQLEPTICADGSGWLVAYATEGLANVYRVRGVRVDSQGAVGTPFLIDSGRQPALAASGSGSSLIAYVDPSLVPRVARITGTTSTLEASGNPADGTASRPAIAATATSWFVAWVSEASGSPAVICALSMDGGVLQSRVLSAGPAATNPTVAMGGATGDIAFVYWEQSGNIVGARADSILPLAVHSNARSPALASAASGDVPTLGFLEANRLTVIDASSGSTMVANVSARARDLVLAATSLVYAAWTEDTLLGADVWTASLLPGGNTPPSPFVLSQAPAPQRLPHVAFPEGSRDGLAVWVEGSARVLAARVQLQTDGSVSVASAFEVLRTGSGGVVGLDVAASVHGGDFAVAWALAGGTVAVALTDLNRVTGAPIELVVPTTTAGSGASTSPALAWDSASASWVVAWGQGLAGVKSRLVSTAAVASGVRSHSQEVVTNLGLACLNGTCLVAWQRALDSNVRSTVFAAGISTTNPFPIPIPIAVGEQPVVTDDGTDFIVGYRSTVGFTFARVNPLTGVVESPGSVTATAGSRLGSLSLARGTPPVMAWSELDTAAGISNLYVERMRFPPPRVLAARGLVPAIGTVGLSQSSGVLVFQRYDVDPNVQSMRGWATGFAFPAADAGVDAGVDAGIGDAGTDLDAGIDAGVDDGGSAADGGVVETPDAGTVIFTSSGCTCQSLASAPLALALLLMSRRTRR